MIKNIFIYWAQGFSNAPLIVKMCLLSWKIKNPQWTLYELDDSNISHFINMDDYVNKQISKTGYSDIVRIYLLERYGGCWCDATTFCNVPLDDWLPNASSFGFFAFPKSGQKILISSWFLYCDLNNHIAKAWKNEVISFWQNRNKANNYFWFHRLFNVLYMKDSTFKQIWDSTPKILAIPYHKDTGFPKSPVYKLSYKKDVSKHLIFIFRAYLSYLLLFRVCRVPVVPIIVIIVIISLFYYKKKVKLKK